MCNKIFSLIGKILVIIIILGLLLGLAVYREMRFREKALEFAPELNLRRPTELHFVATSNGGVNIFWKNESDLITEYEIWEYDDKAENNYTFIRGNIPVHEYGIFLRECPQDGLVIRGWLNKEENQYTDFFFYEWEIDCP